MLGIMLIIASLWIGFSQTLRMVGVIIIGLAIILYILYRKIAEVTLDEGSRS
jgi:hypothetical protein